MKRLREKILLSLSLCLLLGLGSERIAVAQDSPNPPQQANSAVLSQLFPGRTISPDELAQYRTVQLDLNGDKIKEWVVIYNPNRLPKKKTPKRKGCLCPKPKPQGDAKTLGMIGKVKSALEKYEDYLYQIKVTGKKSKKIHVWYQLEKKPPMKEDDLALQVVRRIGRKLGRWKRWRVREVVLVNVDDGKTFKLNAWRTKKIASSPSRKRQKLFQRWYKQSGETEIPLCKCPKKKPKRIVHKALEVIVATELPTVVPTPKPGEPAPELAPAPTGPKVQEIGRLRADNVELHAITRAGTIYAIQCENSVSLGTLRKQEQTFYTYDHMNKKLNQIITLTTSREGDESDAAGRRWAQFKFQNMDADEWLELVVDRYYETPSFNGMLGRTLYKLKNGVFKPINEVRGILSITTSSTWSRVGPKGTVAEQARLSMRTRPQNLADGFRETIWVANKSPRGIGEWARIVFIKPRSLLGVAISAQQPTLLKHVADEYYPGGESAAPPLIAPTFIRIKTANSKTYDVAMKEGQKYTFFRFPGEPIRTSFLRLEIIKEYRDPTTGRTQRLTIPEKEKSLGFIGEVIPVFNEINYTASSYQSQSVEGYFPANAGDNQSMTAWGEGRKDDGLGEWLQLTMPIPQMLNSISVSNGCRRPGERYILNNRIKTAKLTFSNGSSQEVSLKDTDAKQVVTFRPVRTSSVRLTILSVYKGKIGHLTCVTEFHPGR